MLANILKVVITVLLMLGLIYLFPSVGEWIKNAIQWLLNQKYGLVIIASCIILALIKW